MAELDAPRFSQRQSAIEKLAALAAVALPALVNPSIQGTRVAGGAPSSPASLPLRIRVDRCPSHHQHPAVDGYPMGRGKGKSTRPMSVYCNSRSRRV